MVKLTHFDVNQFAPFTVGFDRVFDRLVDYGTTYDTGGFPPYNIRKTDDFKHVIEIALAGFSKGEIEVILTDGVLEIKSSNLPTTEKPKDDLIHKGIAKREAGIKPIKVLKIAVKVRAAIISLILIGAIKRLVKFLLQISSRNIML